MKVIASAGRDDLARVFIVEFEDGKRVECAESLQPPRTLNEKWVMLVSTLFGCPVGCSMCDAGGGYRGKLSSDEIIAQVEMMIMKRFPDMRVPSKQFKVQFSRMGEPALNPQVITALSTIPARIHAPGFMPSISTVAPRGTGDFFQKLRDVKEKHYSRGAFQLQFSLHTTDPVLRRKMIPVDTWSMEEMGEYGSSFRSQGDRKITLNFALAENAPLSPEVLLKHFDPEDFLVKLTPLNPTYRAREAGLSSMLTADCGNDHPLAAELAGAGYQVIVSIGEGEENRIGSNCGQYLRAHMESGALLPEGYTYTIG